MSDSTNASSKDNAALMWILAIFFSWLSSLIFYLTKKDDAYVLEESRQALNLSLNFFVIMLVISILSGVLASIVGILGTLLSLLLLVLWIGFAYLCFMNWKSVKQGTAKPKVPFLIELIK